MKNILWVEDEKDMFNAFAYLALKTYKVERAEDYEKAKIMIDKNDYDLYVIDIILPSGKKIVSEEELMEIKDKYFGLDLIYDIRKSGDEKPIIVVSVVDSKAIVDKIKTAGADIDFLWKYNAESKDVKKSIDNYLAA